LSAEGWDRFAYQVLGELSPVNQMQRKETSRRGSVA